jgi:hypothetical protein
MGRDVQNTLVIRGPKEQLDRLEATGLTLQTLDPTLKAISNLFFGPNTTILERTDHYLRITFMTRHGPPYAYLSALLLLNRQCWMKNTYKDDEGNAGVWMGSIIRGEVGSQAFDWLELTQEEEMHETNFELT